MPKKTFTEALRDAVGNPVVSRYQNAKDTGIAVANLSRLVHATRGLSMKTLDAIREYLGLERVSPKPWKPQANVRKGKRSMASIARHKNGHRRIQFVARDRTRGRKAAQHT